ncbi:hypothetical protein K490DRAFT_68458 [Saccharata proteae CBS 121410]|uniref:F-box domain-containing protein n=1 Tax=Saccharata proteae CBS 121410 TaxID=1314787 RepID=A0A9P4HN35_9PEZI|nr:hypothetical protein K490DRAFT_68458 [Saccharata proteae CBS 121410]
MATFTSLPTELMLQILSYLSPDHIVNLSLANYTGFQSRLLVPAMTDTLLDDLNLATLVSFDTLVCSDDNVLKPRFGPYRMSNATFHVWSLPAEITYMILEDLPPKDMVRFVLNNWPLLSSMFSGNLSGETLKQLKKANLQVGIATILIGGGS